MAFSAKPSLGRATTRPSLQVCSAKFRPQSRIGKQPVVIPSTCKYTLENNFFTVTGPNGTLERQFHPLVQVTDENNVLTFARLADSKEASAVHGMSRALGANMVTGVSEGFTKVLELRGVGYRAATDGKALTLQLGYSHPVVMPLPEGVSCTVERTTGVTLTCKDKDLLGNFAAVVRSKRPPEPYKGKGIRYLGEVVKQKAGKSGKK